MNKFFINRNYYSSSDWHDWKEWHDTIFINNNCFFSEDELLDIIWNDMDIWGDMNCNTHVDKSNILSELKDGEKRSVYSDEYCDMYVTKKKNGNKTEYILDIESFIATHITYYIKPAINPKFVPTRQMIEAPKISPGTYRLECGYFDTFEEAKEALLTMPKRDGFTHLKCGNEVLIGHRLEYPDLNIAPFFAEKLIIIVENEEDIINESVWEQEKKLIEIRNKDPEKYYKNYAPFIKWHLEKISTDTGR